MNLDLGMPLVPEVALFILAVLVLLAGIVQKGDPARRLGWLSFVGLLLVLALTWVTEEGRTLFGGSFVQDGLAIFAKRLSLAAAALSVLASLTARQESFSRRSAEYHFVLLSSLLGMLEEGATHVGVATDHVVESSHEFVRYTTVNDFRCRRSRYVSSQREIFDRISGHSDSLSAGPDRKP